MFLYMNSKAYVLTYCGLLENIGFAICHLLWVDHVPNEQGPLLLSWINFNLSMEQKPHAQ